MSTIAATIGLQIPGETVLIALDAAIALTLLATVALSAGIIAASALDLPSRVQRLRRSLRVRMDHLHHPAGT